MLLVVSHDRTFMDNVADRLLILKGDGLVRLFDGTYSDYLDLVEAEKAEQAVRETRSHSAAFSCGMSAVRLRLHVLEGDALLTCVKAE